VNIARPANGFEIRTTAAVDALIRSACSENDNFERYWADVIERLRYTAHREGRPEPRLGVGYRLIAIEGVSLEGRPRLVIGYLALGDSVIIKLLRIS